MKVQFTIDMPNKEIGQYSFNQVYKQAWHWTKRKQVADYIHKLVYCTMIKQEIPRIAFKKPVKVILSYNSRLDIDNHSFVSKLIVDGLKGYLIENDNRKYVAELDQKFWNGEGILVEIEEV